MARPQPIHETVKAEYKNYSSIKPANTNKTPRRARKPANDNQAPSDKRPVTQRNSTNIVNARRHRNAKKLVDVLGGGKVGIKKAKTYMSAVKILGNVAYPMLGQTIFALLVLVSLVVEDTWWGWIDFIDVTLKMASIFWLTTTMFGTYTMFIAAFQMGKHFKRVNTVLSFIVCFSANWVPGIQIVPWVGVWILHTVANDE